MACVSKVHCALLQLWELHTGSLPYSASFALKVAIAVYAQTLEELQYITCLNSDSHSYKLHFCICLLLLYSLSLTFSTSAIKLQLFDWNFSNYKHTHEHSICNPFCGHDIYVCISIDLNWAGWCGGNTVSVCLGVVWCES